MKRTFWTMAMAVLIVGWMGPSLAASDDVIVEEMIRIKIPNPDGEMESLELEDLAIGETRQMFTDSGTEVIVSRDDANLVIEVGGERIEIAMPDEHVALLADREGSSTACRMMILQADGEETIELLGDEGPCLEHLDVNVDHVSHLDGEDAEGRRVKVLVKRIGDDALLCNDENAEDCLYVDRECTGDCDPEVRVIRLHHGERVEGDVDVQIEEDADVGGERRVRVERRVIRRSPDEDDEQ